MLKNLKIGNRMALGFGLLLVVMVVLIWDALNSMGDIQSQLERIVKINNVRIDACNDSLKNLDQVFINVRNIIITSDQAKMQEYQQRIGNGLHGWAERHRQRDRNAQHHGEREAQQHGLQSEQ